MARRDSPSRGRKRTRIRFLPISYYRETARMFPKASWLQRKRRQVRRNPPRDRWGRFRRRSRCR